MNGEASDQLRADLVRVGARLRELRKERGWKLEDVSERTELSRAYLSRLESGECQPSLTALFSLAQAYGVTFSSLFETESEPRSFAVARAAELPVQRGNELLYSKLSDGNWSFNLRPLRVVVPAEREADVVYRHEGEQWLHVLAGRLGFEIEDERLVLERGDSVHFDAESPHRLSALDGRDAEIILVACAVPYLLLKSYL